MKKKDLQALWAQLGEGVEDDADVPEAKIVEVIQKNAHPVFQIIYDRGHSTATEAGNRKVTDLESQLEKLKKDHETATQALADERRKHPDTDTIRTQYEEREQELKAEHEKAVAELNGKLQNERLNTARQTLKGYLTSGERRLDPDYADVQLDKSELRERFRHRDDGTLEVLQAGKQIALVPADGVSPLELLAKELKDAAPSKFVEVHSDRGAGSQGNGGSSGGAGGFFGKYREELKKERENKPTSVPDGEAEAKKRLGVI